MTGSTPTNGEEHAGKAPTPAASDGSDSPEGDRLDAVREQLDEVADLPVEERAAVFEDINQAIVEELGAMEDL